MTLESITKVRCSLCGHVSEQKEVTSTYCSGGSDLDSRSSGIERSTLETFVQHCTGCGSYATKLDEQSKNVTSVLKSEEYLKLVKNPFFNRLVKSFLCKAYIEEDGGRFACAFWSTLHACWVLDDLGEKEQSVEIRKIALLRFKQAVANKQPITNSVQASTLIFVDLLRRSGLFSDADQLINKEGSKIKDPQILRILRFQKFLIQKKDTELHSICDAESFDEQRLQHQRTETKRKAWWKIF